MLLKGGIISLMGKKYFKENIYPLIKFELSDLILKNVVFSLKGYYLVMH